MAAYVDASQLRPEKRLIDPMGAVSTSWNFSSGLTRPPGAPLAPNRCIGPRDERATPTQGARESAHCFCAAFA